MINLLEQEIHSHGDKSRIVPIDWLQKLKNDIQTLKNGALVDEYTKMGISQIYEFNVPKLDFYIRSIIVVATPSHFVKVIFNYNGREIPLLLPPGVCDWLKKKVAIEKYLNEFLNPLDFHAKIAFNIPQKIITVRSGLGRYGRNNICYINGIGSFFSIETFYSDIVCTDSNWSEIQRLDTCTNCKICLNNCPTKAIVEDSDIIKAGRCLTRYNEQSGEFPGWIDPSSHNCIIGCVKCQIYCPNNKPYVNQFIDPILFTRDETDCILDSKPFDQLSDALQEKLNKLDAQPYYGILPRNLNVLLGKSDIV